MLGWRGSGNWHHKSILFFGLLAFKERVDLLGWFVSNLLNLWPYLCPEYVRAALWQVCWRLGPFPNFLLVYTKDSCKQNALVLGILGNAWVFFFSFLGNFGRFLLASSSVWRKPSAFLMSISGSGSLINLFDYVWTGQHLNLQLLPLSPQSVCPVFAHLSEKFRGGHRAQVSAGGTLGGILLWRVLHVFWTCFSKYQEYVHGILCFLQNPTFKTKLEDLPFI